MLPCLDACLMSDAMLMSATRPPLPRRREWSDERTGDT